MGTPVQTIVPQELSKMPLPQLADAFGEANEALEQAAIPYDKAAKLHGALKKELQARYAEAPATEDHEAEGATWLIKISRRRNEKSLSDPWAAYKALRTNLREFVALVMAFVPQSFLVDRLGVEAASELYTEAPTGWRTLKPVRKPKRELSAA